MEDTYRGNNPEATNAELRRNLEQLRVLVQTYESRMLNKDEVAKRLGMTVSWLDNSQCEKALKLRSIRVRYGRSHSSPVRFPLSEVARISMEDECAD